MDDRHKVNLKSFIFIAACVVVIIGICCWSWINTRQFESSSIAETQKQLLTIAKAEAAHIEDIFSNLQNHLELSALNPDIQMKVKTSVVRGDIPVGRLFRMRHVFKYLGETLKSIDRIDSKGIAQGRSPFDKSIEGKDFSERPDVKFVLENHKPYISGMFTTERGFKAISISVPVYEGFEKEKFIGIIRAVVSMDAISSVVGNIKVGAKGYAWIIDVSPERAGMMLCHPEPEYIGCDIMARERGRFPDFDCSKFEGIVGRMKNGEEGVGVYESAWWTEKKPKIEKKLIGFAPVRIGDVSWSIGVSMGYDEIARPIGRNTRNNFLGAGFLILVFVAGGSNLYMRQLKAKEESEKKAGELVVLNKQLEKATNAKSEFLANMSHELRTPLNAVIGFTEVLLDRKFGELNEKQAKYQNNVLISAKHLLGLINDILDISKVEAGRMELSLSEFSFVDMVENAKIILKEAAFRKNVTIESHIDSGISAITADEKKVKQIMYNLLSNAVKFTPERGRISINGAIEEGMLRVSVADTGIGIKKEDTEKLFKTFQQIESSYTREYKGTGLGLALTKKLVELHGGEIQVDSEFGKGTTFTFTIPLRRDRKA